MTAPTTLADDLEIAPAPQVPAVLFRGLSIAQIDLYEARIETATRAALRRVMRQVTANLGETTTAAALVADASAISPDDLSGIGPLWRAQVETQLQPVVAQVYRDAGATLHASMVEAVGDLPRVSSVAAETYLAQSATTFDAIGAQLWETARTQLIDGMAAGEDIPALAARLRTTVPDLTARQATLVARTQVNDAANAGSYATAQASGLDLVKGWESTADLRTRESHLFAGSRYSGPGMIPMAENFMVGGWACERPHDLELPPAERYNCRCTLVYGMREGPQPSTRQARVDALEADYVRRVTALEAAHTARMEQIESAFQAQVFEAGSDAAQAAVAAHEARVAELVAAYEARRELMARTLERRLAIARGEEPPTPLPMAAAPAPGVEPVIPVAGQPTLVPVRAALAEAQTVPEVRQVFITEWDRIIAGQPGAVRGSVRFSPTADVQTVREHAEGLLRGLERFPAVRMDVTSGGISAYGQTVGREIKFATSWGRQREEYLASLREAGARNAQGIAFHPTTISSPQGVALHEFGHILEYAYAFNAQGGYDYRLLGAVTTKVKRIIAELANERGIGTTDLVKLEIGEYAAGSTQELLAEAFADAMINGDAASELSRRIFAMLVREYERVTPPRAGGVVEAVEPLATKAVPPAVPVRIPEFEFPAGTDMVAVRELRDQLRLQDPAGYNLHGAWDIVDSDFHPAAIDAIMSRLDRVVALRVAREADNDNSLRRFIQMQRPLDPNADPYADLPPITAAEIRAAKERAEEVLRQEFAGKPIAIRMRDADIEAVLTSGRVKTLFESGRSSSLGGGTRAYREMRTEREEALFGIPRTAPASERPIYGYVGIDGIHPLGGSGRLNQYGDVQVILKPSVARRATISEGDTLDEDVLPSPMTAPRAESFNGILRASRTGEDAWDPVDWQHSYTYPEAHIHGGVTLADIEEVVFSRPPPAAMIRLLDDAGIRYQVLRPGDVYIPRPPALATGPAPLADGLDVLELHSLRSLATEFEISNASRLGRERLLAELRQRGAQSPAVRAIEATNQAEAQTLLEAAPARFIDLPTVPGGDLRDEFRLEWRDGPPAGWGQAKINSHYQVLFDYSAEIDDVAPWALRAESITPATRRAIRSIDEVMQTSPLDHSVVVWRGSADVGRLIGGDLGRNLTGVSFVDPSFMSTSALREVARDFAAQKGYGRFLLRLEVPAGTRAVALGYDAAELLLDRGLTITITADRWLPGGIRLLEATVEDRKVDVFGRAIAETLGMLDAGTDLATIVESLTGRAELKDLLAIVRRAKDRDKLATSLRGFATRRNIVIPTKTQLKALQAAERKAAAAAKREAALAARAEKARLAEVKAQVKAVHAGDFRSLAQTDTGAYQASDGSLWTVESFASEREARERVLAMALRDLVDPGPGGPQPLAVAGQGAPGPGGWQVAYVGTVPRAGVTLDDWLGSVSLEQLKRVTPARLRALVGKVGLGPDDAERLIARRADAVLREQLLAKRFRSRGGPLLTDLKALAADTSRAKLIDGPYGSMGLRARVSAFNVRQGGLWPGGSFGSSVEISGDVIRNGRIVGQFARDYYLDNGEWIAHHSYLQLDPALQGSGFAEEFNANLIDWYRRSGIKEVRLTANISVGGYAWASAGYGFASEISARNILITLERVVKQLKRATPARPPVGRGAWLFGQLSQAEIDAQVRTAEALLKRATRYQFGDPRFPTAYEISQLGRWAGAGKDDVWIGKVILLGSNWEAVLYL